MTAAYTTGVQTTSAYNAAAYKHLSNFIRIHTCFTDLPFCLLDRNVYTENVIPHSSFNINIRAGKETNRTSPGDIASPQNTILLLN